jgi:hypothetical protein
MTYNFDIESKVIERFVIKTKNDLILTLHSEKQSEPTAEH